MLATDNQYVHTRMMNTGGYAFDLTIVYGERTAVKRRQLWEGIASFRPISSAKDWLIIGDFNKIRHPSEREGRGAFDRAGASEFESAIAGFMEIATIGGDFTWTNDHTRSRLDRVLGNTHWLAKWSQARPRLIHDTTSDHVGSPIYTLQEKINMIRKMTKNWAKSRKSNTLSSRQVASLLQTEATKLQSNPHCSATQMACNDLKARLINLQISEQSDLRQKAHIEWITLGDQSTRFFAQAIKARHARNSIMRTINEEGRQTNSMSDMKARATTYFTDLFNVENREKPISNLNIDRRPTEVENAKLRYVPCEAEIRLALTSMPTGKAPGMDDITSEILAFHWSSISNDIISTVLHFFRTKRMLRSLNLAILTLMPKKVTSE